MKTFNVHRFWNVVKWNIAYHRDKIVKSFLSCFAVFFGLLMFFCWSIADEFSRIQAISNMFYLAFFVMIIISGSMLLRHVKNKQDRIDLFMLPASMLEKFSVRYLMTVVGMPLLFLLGFLAGDVLQYLVTWMIDSDRACLVIPHIVQRMGQLKVATLYGGILLWWLHSVYLLGGMLFRKAGWLWTTLSLILLFNIIVFGLGYLAKEILDMMYPDGYVILLNKNFDAMWGKIIYVAVMCCLTLLNYWLAFRLFRRMQIINNRWFNV